METNFNFKSQICTDRFQSERLLALGLKKETADMVLTEYSDGVWRPSLIFDDGEDDYDVLPFEPIDIPAWSLHRLWELDRIHYITLDSEDEIATLYDAVIDNIEKEIKAGKFNKEYLV